MRRAAILLEMQEPADVVRFYDECYTGDPADGEVYARWRALGALGKADHVVELCARAGLRPASVLDVGCGDGALLSELHRRDFGGSLSGVEITEVAVAIARNRVEIQSVELYDGLHLRAPDGAYDLGVVSHVLEHVPDPSALLGEVARACRAVVVEVPLEANWSAWRRGKRCQAAELGHLQRLDHAATRELVASSGLRIACELDDPLPLDVHRFFAATRPAQMTATGKWAVRAGLYRVAPSVAARLFTLHYACLCVRPVGQPANRGDH